MASLHSPSISTFLDHSKTPNIFGSALRLGENDVTLFRLLPNSSKLSSSLRTKAVRMPPGITKEAENIREKTSEAPLDGCDPFGSLKQHFFSFKRDKYLANKEHFQNLAMSQAPKFTVIACADSRVCPSTILGFQPGEAFTVRNVGNLVPPFETGPSETKAALEFSVNALQVEHILVIGHSCCGGIRALMSMQEEEEEQQEESRSFIRSWVIIGKNARLSTKSVASNFSFDQQCQHCEKESINHSLINLLSYPWIKERIAEGKLSLHGGYYDFTDCTFEKWTLDHRGIHQCNEENKYSMKDREVWR